MPTLTDLPTDHLVPHERNLRSGVGDLSDLIASIGAVGILQPLLVVPLHDHRPETQHDQANAPDGTGAEQFQIIVGHRRHAAAAELAMTTVPCIIAADQGEADRVVKMLAENVHRQGLTTTEEAEAYRQLALLDWTPEQISRVTAKPADHVRHALALTTLPQQVRTAADAGQLDRADAAAMGEFTDDPKALDRILSRGRGWGFSHAVAEERAKRERRDLAERLKAELVLAGARVTTRPKDFGYSSREVEASTLLDGAGQPVDPDVARTLAGFAVFVEAQASPPRAVVYCTDPEAHGYTRTRPTSYVPPAVAEQRVREQAERDAHAQALTVATTVRRDFLATIYGTVKGAKTVHTAAWRDAMLDPDAITVSEAMLPLVSRLAGCDPTAAVHAGTDRLARLLVARWLTASEEDLAHLIARQMWRAHPARGLAYLDRLTTAGYVLSEAEQRLHADLTHLVTDTDADTDEDIDDEPDDADEPDADAADADDDTDDEPVAEPDLPVTDAPEDHAVHLAAS